MLSPSILPFWPMNPMNLQPCRYSRRTILQGLCSTLVVATPVIGLGRCGYPLQARPPQTRSPQARSPEANPQPSQSHPGIRIGVISDLNSQYGSTTYDPEVAQAIALMRQWQPDLVVCGGDMVAGQKTSLSEAEITAMWAGFERTVRQPLRQAGIPFGFTLGNHDGSGARNAQGQDIFERDRRLARRYWASRDTGLNFVDRAGFPFYYSFSLGSVFVLVWDASTATVPPAQIQWAERSFQSAVVRRASLRLVIGHLPLYPVAVGRDRPGEFLAQGDSLRDRLLRWGVHTYISGHQHAYYPGHSHQLQLLYSGAAGSGPRRLLAGNAAPRKTVTLIEVSEAKASAPPGSSARALQTRYRTYQLPDLTPIESQSLPPGITTPYGRVQRTDAPD